MHNRSPLPLIALAAVLVAGVVYATSQPAPQQCVGPNCPGPVCPGPNCPQPYPYPTPEPYPEPVRPQPCPGPGPCPPQPRRPWGDATGAVVPDVGAIREGGPVAPDGVTEVQVDLPVELRQKNVGGRDGAGLCVFASIQHAARWQNVRQLWNLIDQMHVREPGGGWPQKVDEILKRYAPGVPYTQHTGGDVEFLRAALAGGRSPGVTYCGRDVHYGGASVAHMVNLVHLDQTWACVLDNNYIGERQLVWMSVAEFVSRWKGQGQGWAVVLLDPPPMPAPHN